MPITYSVSENGRFIHAIAYYPVSNQEFIDYEIAHAIDERIKSPVTELFEIRDNALKKIGKEDIESIINRRKELSKSPVHHKCGIVVSINDTNSWDIAKFYEGMYTLHFPESVIVFGDVHIAMIWLGVKEEQIIYNS
jgi:hypothetical protein